MPRTTWDEPRRRRGASGCCMPRWPSSAGTAISGGSLNVIAREAGVAKGSLFQYFDDKFDLFAHVAEQASLRDVRRDGAVPRTRRATASPFVDHFSGLVDVWIGYMATHPLERGVTAATTMELDPQVRARGARAGAPALRQGSAAVAAAGVERRRAARGRRRRRAALAARAGAAASGPGAVRAGPGRRARAARHEGRTRIAHRPGAWSTPCWLEVREHDRTTTS